MIRSYYYWQPPTQVISSPPRSSFTTTTQRAKSLPATPTPARQPHRTAGQTAGVAAERPTVILTDNKANLLVANDAASASRSRHCLRRYHALQQRIAAGEAQLLKVPNEHMPADFLTKWINKEKLKKSVKYATNSGNAVNG